MNTRKNLLLWILYDFANSIVSIVFFLYFSQWIVIDRGVADIWFNLTFTISALLLLLTVPTTGVLLDKYWRRVPGLRYTTLGTVIFYGLCGVFAIGNHDILALTMFTLGLYSYLLSFTFYTPLINDIGLPSERGRISGYGVAANYSGQIAGLVLVLPFATGQLNLFGSSLRAETLLPAVAAFFLLSLPTLLLFREPHKERRVLSYTKEIRESIVETKMLITVPGVLAFFIAYFFFNDAILTAANNFSIFLEQVWKVSDTIKTYILLGILTTSAIGGFMSGLIADKVGHKRTLVFILSGWVIILPAVALVNNFKLFIVAVTLMGFWFGSTWTVSRSVMSYLAPKGKHNLAFAYFGLVERASSFVGPIVWGLIATNLVSLGAGRYRLAASVLTVFVVLGLVVLRKIPTDKVVF